jgi:uncharacterized protein YukE
VDQIIIAAADVVEAWDDHTLELEATIRRLAEALQAHAAETRHSAQAVQLVAASAAR